MKPRTHPPVAELLPFDDASLQDVSIDRCSVVATGVAPCNMGEYAIEQTDGSHDGWVPCRVVGYHFGECPPDPTAYAAQATIELHPGAKGIELAGSGRVERLPLIFRAE